MHENILLFSKDKKKEKKEAIVLKISNCENYFLNSSKYSVSTTFLSPYFL